MNTSEANFYSWLIKQGHDPSEITCQADKTPDFIGPDAKWEVKKLYGNQILIRSKTQMDYVDEGGEEDFVAVMPENPKEDRNPIAIIPCSEITVGEAYKTKDLEKWSPTGEIAPTHFYPWLRINPVFKDQKGKKISVYLKNGNLLDWFESQIEKGRYRNLSHAVEKALEAEKRKSISY